MLEQQPQQSELQRGQNVSLKSKNIPSPTRRHDEHNRSRKTKNPALIRRELNHEENHASSSTATQVSKWDHMVSKGQRAQV
jgi:hypothetical protein